MHEPLPPDDPGAPPRVPGLIEDLRALWAELRGSTHDHLQLAALEAQRAVLSLVWIAIYGTVIGVLGAATWLVVAGALVLRLIDSGLGASTALLLGGALNLLGALGFALLMRRKSRVLLFPATLRGFDPETTSIEPARTEPAREP